MRLPLARRRHTRGDVQGIPHSREIEPVTIFHGLGDSLPLAYRRRFETEKLRDDPAEG